jgi:hypothetical protein
MNLDRLENDYEYGIGVDPGWKNLGLAIVSKRTDTNIINLLGSYTLNPAELGGYIPTCKQISNIVMQTVSADDTDKRIFTMERYVAYNNVITAEAENILMMIGAIVREADEWDIEKETRLVRAIDWKTHLVKQLFKKKQFDNPSTSLDKKFSKAAAMACIDNLKEFNNDHEADAICLACLPFFQ